MLAAAAKGQAGNTTMRRAREEASSMPMQRDQLGIDVARMKSPYEGRRDLGRGSKAR